MFYLLPIPTLIHLTVIEIRITSTDIGHPIPQGKQIITRFSLELSYCMEQMCCHITAHGTIRPWQLGNILKHTHLLARAQYECVSWLRQGLMGRFMFSIRPPTLRSSWDLKILGRNSWQDVHNTRALFYLLLPFSLYGAFRIMQEYLVLCP